MRTRLAEAGGLIVVASGVGLFLSALALRDWYWPRFGVPGGTGFSFLDARFFTSAWECVRRGVDVTTVNPCDPLERPMNYPRLWLAPAPLGLGRQHTAVLGGTFVVLFFLAVAATIRRLRPADGLVYAAALCSPSVLLGVERGNPDLPVFALVVAGLLLLRAASPRVCAAAHGLLLLAAMLKLYPVLAWLPALRQPRRRLVAGVGGIAAAFGVYALLTRDDIRAVRELAPRETIFSYGAGILGAETFGTAAVLAVGLLGAALVVALARRTHGASSVSWDDRDLDLFQAGAAVFVGTFALGYNFNYRLAFLLLTIPQLLRWSRDAHAPVPLARLGLTAVLASLWLGASIAAYPFGLGEWWEDVLAGFPYDELASMVLFAYLVGAVVLTVARRPQAGVYANAT